MSCLLRIDNHGLVLTHFDWPNLFLEELGWKTLHHPPYSTGLAASDPHCFRGLLNHFDGIRLTTREELNIYLNSKPTEFYKQDISKLFERWDQVIESNGGYVNEEIFSH